MTHQAHHAVRAAQIERNVGKRCAILYAKNRGVPPRLLILARQLQANLKDLQS